MKKAVIYRGKEESLGQIPFHEDASFLERVVLFDKGASLGINMIAAHYIDIPQGHNMPSYVNPHKHNDLEINLILSAESIGLEYEIIIDGKREYVKSPATIIIPPGTEHSAKALRGKGMYICIKQHIKY